MNRRQMLEQIIRLSPFMLVIAAVAPVSSKGHASDTRNLEVKAVHSVQNAQTFWIKDDRAHYVALGKRTGSAEFSDGQKARYIDFFHVDSWLGRRSSFQIYSRFNFDDGSVIFARLSAKGFRNRKNLPHAEGKGEIYAGIGRFKGIKGTITFTNQQLEPTSKNPKRTSELNAVIEYTLP